MVYDAIIVGGGPVAGYIAAELSQSGFSTLVLEEHSRIGVPVQCAGLVTTKLDRIVDLKPCILNTVNGAYIFSPLLHRLVLDSGTPKAYVIDRSKFDQMLMDKALDLGAEVRTGSKLSSVKRLSDQNGGTGIDITATTNEGKKQYKTNLVIGADGANSTVRRFFDFDPPRMMLKGIGREFKFADIPREFVQIFSGNEIAPGFFAWAIPAGDRVRIGLCVASGTAELVDYFNNYQKLCRKRGLIPDSRPVQRITGTIPLGVLDRTTADNVMLVGDAAAQVKPTSGGGIYPGLRSAKLCAETAVSSLEAGDQSNGFLQQYHQNWRKQIGNDLEKGLRLHRAFMHLSDDRIEEAFNILDKTEILRVISRKGDIESPFALAKLLFKKAPRLIKFAGPYFRSLSLK